MTENMPAIEDHPYIENTGGGSGCGHWYPQGTYSLERDYRCGYPELDHRLHGIEVQR